MGLIYLDTSAAAKLVHTESESAALGTYLVERIQSVLASSTLLYPELVRAVSRHRPQLRPRAVALMQRIMTVPMDWDIVTSSATIGTPMLRTLDALHLATATSIKDELDAFVSYDKRLCDAALEVGMTVDSPA
ncbi:MAG TPA: type II toxin-antitoxin system VapC family toxin [Stackebrandtia sp.]|jgi:predicted nucleic acid-binding protein|uniref:type II toxin-antitoxin system VapC family toxin n=1 Tax=Stackebrandtia sp. TaxID=2023065 RepID=UPI002D57C44F|nr:type II toxin-antitoxin system VapC family toxin [Stackebrandtia sp.]HZE39992.1 type II toxin-antitoxin system VapC family toxin [Stackebrandtia sp.]